MTKYSLGRRTDPGARREYRNYLGSAAWRRRRARWFEDSAAAGFEPACWACRVSLTRAGSLDLHHLSYDGVSKDERGHWVSAEADEDLIPLCRECHEALHSWMDAHVRDFWGWSRKSATRQVLGYLRKRRRGRTR